MFQKLWGHIARGSKKIITSSFDELLNRLPKGAAISPVYGIYPEEVKKLAKRCKILPPIYDV